VTTRDRHLQRLKTCDFSLPQLRVGLLTHIRYSTVLNEPQTSF
jgi:hypothetical protein